MPETSKKILISGASGLIGSALTQALQVQQIEVLQLSRKPSSAGQQTVLRWDPSAERPVSDPTPLEGLHAAIHLSGANLSSRRWTESYKREIVSSRVDTTLALGRVFSQLQEPPKAFVCASATGIYGNRGSELLTEDSRHGTGFLTDVCELWERAAATAGASAGRVLHTRFGVVLAPNGGALAKMLPLFRAGLGGPLGSGRQWMSWIALPDLVSAMLFLLLDPRAGELTGAFNFTAPGPVTNADFTHALGRHLHRPAILPAPAFALRLAFGQMADEALLASSRALPEGLLKAGYRFQASDIDAALNTVLPRP
ncbi:TIGR01777 family oxidoreductase [Silvibacterium sp.]|uniref:TIGR01777 family oxidoreductase n=1 Tax=Silvibacterium sp. TaxID=1964179 RepID=UPI0039E3E508